MRWFEEFADHQLCGTVLIKIDQNRLYIRKISQKILKKTFKTFSKKIYLFNLKPVEEISKKRNKNIIKLVYLKKSKNKHQNNDLTKKNWLKNN